MKVGKSKISDSIVLSLIIVHLCFFGCFVKLYSFDVNVIRKRNQSVIRNYI